MRKFGKIVKKCENCEVIFFFLEIFKGKCLRNFGKIVKKIFKNLFRNYRKINFF